MDEAIMSSHNFEHHIIRDRALSRGLVLPEWAGITVTRILLTDSWYLATGGSIFDAKYICYDIVGDMVRYEIYDMCVDERRDWHALGESWKSIFQ